MSKIIGLGAAGNKAVIEAIKDGVPRENCLLINSTLKDINPEYHDISINIGGQRGGCGKERTVSKELTVASFEDGTLDLLDALIEPLDETVYLVTSTEGGSGSGATPLIANYLNTVLNLEITIVAFTGFEDDARGLLNTVDFFKELKEEYTVQIISNSKFLDDINRNKIKAQVEANREFVSRLRIMLGRSMVDSENNIDETDLHKVLNTPGYMTVESGELKAIKNIEQFNKELASIIDSSKSVDVSEPSAKRLAVILNTKEQTEEVIDFEFTIIKRKLGIPFEVYTHVQNEDGPEFIQIIVAGMRLPIDELSDMYNRYKDSMKSINRDKDSFFDSLQGMTDTSIDEFNSAKRTAKGTDPKTERKNKLDFLKSLDVTASKDTVEFELENNNIVTEEKDNGDSNY